MLDTPNETNTNVEPPRFMTGRTRILIGAVGAVIVIGGIFATWNFLNAQVFELTREEADRLSQSSQTVAPTQTTPPLVVETTPLAADSATVTPTQTPTSSTSAAPSPTQTPTSSTSAAPSPTQTSSSPSPTTQPSSTPTQTKESGTQPPLLLKSIGLDLGTYDPATGRAGDFKFTNDAFQFNLIWADFGFRIPGNQTDTGKDKYNPQPTYTVPLGTKVRSLVDGVVVNIATTWSGDYSIMVAKDTNSNWMYETEHVVNPMVKVGDKVTAGQPIADVINFGGSAPAGFGQFEIGILYGGAGEPQHVCPYAYLDPSVKSDIQAKIRALYQSWEAFKGDTSIYDEASMPVPGCASLNSIAG